jgi:hypothetical protein
MGNYAKLSLCLAKRSTRHGNTAQIAANRRNAVLPDEDVDAFDELQRAFHEQYQPVGPAELLCVEEMILSFWGNRATL